MDHLLETKSISNTDAEIRVNSVNCLMIIFSLSEDDLFVIKIYPSEDAPGLQKLSVNREKSQWQLCLILVFIDKEPTIVDKWL